MSEQDFEQELEEIKAQLDAMDARDEAAAQAQPAPEKPKKGGKALYYILLTVFAGTFLFCAIYIVNYIIQSRQQQDNYDHLSNLVQQNRPTTEATEPQPTESADPTDPTTEPTEPTVTEPAAPTEPTILPEYQVIYNLNNDLVGWINIPGTNIDYPVMQTPAQKDYYLYRNFDKEWSSWGCIYVREECDVFTPSDNVVIYGHRMRDKTMFYQLEHNYQDKSFWQDHQTFSFDTLYEHHTYQIIAVFIVDLTEDDFFAYHLFNDAANEKEFNEFMETVHSLQLYDTGLTAEYGDKLLTLSTCIDRNVSSNSRFVVVAKRIS